MTFTADFRFRDRMLFVADDIEWPDCSDSFGEKATDRSCERPAVYGYLNENGRIAFACDPHATPHLDGRDYWPLAPEREMQDVHRRR